MKLLLNICFEIKESMSFYLLAIETIYLKIKGKGSRTKFLNVTFNPTNLPAVDFSTALSL